MYPKVAQDLLIVGGNMTLELKHLGPYLPHDIEVQLSDLGLTELYDSEQDNSYLQGMFRITSVFTNIDCIQLESIENKLYSVDELDIEMIKPILLPISDLTKEKFIECCNEANKNFKSELIFFDLTKTKKLKLKDLPYELFDKLLQYHFDVFELIEKGLAIDINTLS